MASFQQITVLGNLGRDPELSYLQSGMAVCKFAIAVSEKIKNEEHVEWFNIVCWDKQAENAKKFLTKGDSALVVGRLRTRKYTSKQGEAKTATDLNASQVTFVVTKRAKTDGAIPTPGVEAAMSAQHFDSSFDDIPF